MQVKRVYGKLIDDQTRCEHYHSPLDVIAIKFKCCNHYFACIECHEQTEIHPVMVWPKTEFHTLAILCGICTKEMTIVEYKEGDYHCKYCNAAFNPKCKNHDHCYFEQE